MHYKYKDLIEKNELYIAEEEKSVIILDEERGSK